MANTLTRSLSKGFRKKRSSQQGFSSHIQAVEAVETGPAEEDAARAEARLDSTSSNDAGPASMSSDSGKDKEQGEKPAAPANDKSEKGEQSGSAEEAAVQEEEKKPQRKAENADSENLPSVDEVEEKKLGGDDNVDSVETSISHSMTSLQKNDVIHFTLPTQPGLNARMFEGQVVETTRQKVEGEDGKEEYVISFRVSASSPKSSELNSVSSSSKSKPRGSKRSTMKRGAHNKPSLKATQKDGVTNRYRDLGFHHSQCSGFLWKKNQEGIPGLRRWKLRYCVITEDAFQYFAEPADEVPRGEVLLKHVTQIERVQDQRKDRFTIYADGIKLYEFKAKSEKECNKWLGWLMNMFSLDVPK